MFSLSLGNFILMQKQQAQPSFLIILALLFVTVLFVTGCATQSGTIKTFSEPVDEAIVSGVSIPVAVNLVEVDGKPFNNLLRNNKTDYLFSPGFHKVTLQYEEIWEIGADDHSVIKSKKVEQEWNLVPGGKYALQVKVAKNLEESKVVATEFSPWIKLLEKPAADNPTVAEALSRSADSQQLEQLKVWWERADEHDRSKFRQWIETAQ